MNSDPDPRLQQSLETSIRLVHRLEDALLQETRAVESRTPDALQDAVRQKQELLQELDVETRRQRSLVEAHGESYTPDGMSRMFARLEGGAELDDRWQALRQLLERCDTLNRGNARLIERDRRRVDLSMQILRGEETGPAATYDPQGRTRKNLRGGRQITQA